MSEFTEFPKMPRWSRDVVITEKIDGTNAQVFILPDKDVQDAQLPFVLVRKWNLVMLAGSRNRYITPEADNYGFAKWVIKNADDLFKLNVGRHYGEWWGNGIQRGYGLDHKRFSLFNTEKFLPFGTENPGEKQIVVPESIHVVPILYKGTLKHGVVETACMELDTKGSFAAPGFMDPEGIIIYHDAAKHAFKKTLENDESPKSKVKHV